MPPLKRTEVTFDWAGTQQSKQDRKLQNGELTELVNVRRIEDGPGPLRKRLGLDKTTVSTFSAGAGFETYQGPVTAQENGGDALMFRDSQDQIWVREPDSNTGQYRGRVVRAFPRWYSGSNRAPRGKAHKPVTVIRNGDLWQFSIATQTFAGGGGQFDQYQLTIFDATTRVAKTATTLITASRIVGLAAAVDGSNNVWVFWHCEGTDDHKIFAHKFTAPTSTPTATTFATLDASLIVHQLDARSLSSNGNIAVAALGMITGTPNVIHNYHAYVDTTTGAAKSSPAAVTETQNGGNGSPQTACASGLALSVTDASDGFFSYSFWREKPATANEIELIRVKVNATTLVTNVKTIVDTITGLSGSLGVTLGTTCGFVESGSETLFSSYWQVPSSPNDSESLILTKLHAVGLANGQFVRGCYVAGKPFFHAASGQWFVLLGFDDGPSQRAQRSYLLYRRNASGVAVGFLATTALSGEAPPIFHGGGLAGAPSNTGYTYTHVSPHVVDALSIGGNKWVYGLMREGLADDSPDPTILEIDMAATYHSSVPEIIPGGVPATAGAVDVVRDLSPVFFPARPLTFTSLGTGGVRSVNRLTFRYSIRRSDGSVYRSAPRATAEFTFLDSLTEYACNIPTLRSTNGEAWIEIYGSVNGGTDLFLQRVLYNDPGDDTVGIFIQPQSFIAGGESLDTVGGALEPAPAPPARLVLEHKNRTWLLGTPDGLIWPSIEHREGRGPEFNEALTFTWPRGTGEEQSAASVDDDTLALAKVDAIALVTGPGPDGVGNGSFDVRTLPGKDGCSNPKAFIQGPLGVYFPRHADGRMCLLGVGGVQEIHQGMEDYVSFTWTGAVDDKARRELRWYASNGKILRLDYGHPTPDQPWGQWILDENSNLPAWLGARLINGAPVSMEVGSGSVARSWQPGTGFTDDGTQIAKRWKTGKMAPGGMLGEFDTDHVRISSTVLGGSSAYTYTLIDDVGGTEAHPDASSATADVTFRSARFRTRDVQLQAVETTPSGEGRSFDGAVMEFCLYGRAQSPRRRIG